MPNNDNIDNIRNNGSEPAGTDQAQTPDRAPGFGEGPPGQGPGGAPGNHGAAEFGPTAGEFSPNALDPLQVKTLPDIATASQLTKGQVRGMRKAATASTKAAKAGDRIRHHSAELKRALQAHNALRDLAQPATKGTLPHWASYLCVLVCMAVLTPIERTFVAFVPGLAQIATFAAVALSGVLEGLAWWYGRSLAARHEATTPRLELRHSEKIALKWAVPLAITIQASLFALRLIRTGAIFSSIALTLGVVAAFSVSVYIHDKSYSPREAKERSSGHTADKERRLLGQGNSDFDKAHAVWNHNTEHRIVEPARRIVADVVELTASTDALIRSLPGERVPGPWPIGLGFAAQIKLAHGDLPAHLTFPDKPTSIPDGAQSPNADALKALEGGRP